MALSLTRPNLVTAQVIKHWRAGLASDSEKIVKRILRDICESAQRGLIPHHPAMQQVFNLAKGLYGSTFPDSGGSESVEVNRWVAKVVFEYGTQADGIWIERMIECVSDAETHLCLFICFLRHCNYSPNDLSYQQRRLESAAHVYIAACYTNRTDIIQGFKPLSIEKADEITLKWATLCFALSRGAESVFEPKFDQIEQLAALLGHQDGLVAQYSVYAIWRSPSGDFATLGIPNHAITGYAPNVRRWLYQLLLKHGLGVQLDPDFVADALLNETNSDAKNGVIVSLHDHYMEGSDDVILRAFALERNSMQNRLGILRYMGRFSDRSPIFFEAVADEFQRNESDGIVRQVCLEAAAGRELYSKLRRIEAQEDQSIPLFSENNQQSHMTMINDNRSTININGEGNSVSIANQTGMRLSVNLSDLKAEIDAIQGAPDDTKEEAYRAVEAYQGTPNPKNRDRVMSAFAKLKEYAGLGSLGLGIVRLLSGG